MTWPAYTPEQEYDLRLEQASQEVYVLSGLSEEEIMEGVTRIAEQYNEDFLYLWWWVTQGRQVAILQVEQDAERGGSGTPE